MRRGHEYFRFYWKESIGLHNQGHAVAQAAAMMAESWYVLVVVDRLTALDRTDYQDKCTIITLKYILIPKQESLFNS